MALSPSSETQEKPDYGIDAPEAIRRFLSLGSVLLVVQFAMPAISALLPVHAAFALRSTAPALGAMGSLFVATAGLLLWGSRSGKLRLRDKLLDALPWRGDESVLDIGCGHGLMLIGAAKRLTSGKAIGVDVWSEREAGRNRPESALRNARLEQVAGRVEVHTADARELPFDAQSFDLVLSSWTLHNLPQGEQRQRALQEMLRVLKPGGQLLLIDIRHVREYEGFLRAQGLQLLRRSGPHFLFGTPSSCIILRKP